MSERSMQAASEHPLEALYVARDAAQRAAIQARHVGILSGERTSYETVLGDLLVALGELGAQYRITFPADSTIRRGADSADDRPTESALLRSLPDQLAQVRGEDDPPQSEGKVPPHDEQGSCC